MSYEFDTDAYVSFPNFRLGPPGTGATDYWTIFVKAKKLGSHANSSARVWDAGDDVGSNAQATDEITFQVSGAGGNGNYSVSGVFDDTDWHSFVFIVYGDSNGGSHDPIAYIDGSLASLTENSVLSGTMANGDVTMYFGNRSSQDRGWNGRLAEVAVSTELASAQDALDYHNGSAPNTLLTCLRYYPMVDDLVDDMGSGNTGTAAAGAASNVDHPTAGGGGSTDAGGMLLGSRRNRLTIP